MTVSEFTFLAIGLVLGVASGAALIEVIRARPPARREVRLTVSQDAIPRRRATTLADDAFVAVGPEPARGGPADRRGLEGPASLGAPDRRTNVLAVGHSAAAMTNDPKRAPGRVVGMPISAGADPMLGALQAGGRDTARPSATATAGAGGSSATAVTTGRNTSPAAVGLLDPPADASPVAAPARSGPCADERRLADERCELATRAQAQAAAAADALRRAQRAYDTHTAASTAAAGAAHPRAVRSLKEGAQRAFRAASRAASSPEAIEAAARRWLQEINRINREAAAASLTAGREGDAAASVGATLERQDREANASRIGAEMADAACLAARTAVAECDERTTAGPAVARATPPPPIEPVLSDDRGDEALGIALEGGSVPRIFRLLRGDPGAMETLVAALGGGDPEEQRRWKLALAGLLDAILADAIEQAFLRFPHDHPFWGPYTQQQNRDIIRALASLGHRFDGLGGWVDERLPSQRELSLALGYAGLDPMRMRQWPGEQQTAELFRDVEVAADEYLASVAGDLTLAEMVEMLGRRADSLVELWNHWGRLRPLLLEEA
ncbi:MAG: hypothetical protein Q7S35_04190 [Candidatus Limnocylindrales bacterium]|nr:hypothetical protein [Candidatus Limnocylindrales bacterium]